METNEMNRIEQIKNLIVLIKSDLYSVDWNNIIEDKVNLLNDVYDMLTEYEKIG